MMKHILLTTDLSEEAQRAFHPVSNLAKLIGARITLLHVVQVMTPVSAGALVAGPISPGIGEAKRTDALDVMAEQRALLDPKLEVELDVTTAENISRGVADYASEHDVGLIAISTHGRSGLRRVVLGSVAEGVLRYSQVPVLCFPPLA